jgi:hypothetical protein
MHYRRNAVNNANTLKDAGNRLLVRDQRKKIAQVSLPLCNDGDTS